MSAKAPESGEGKPSADPPKAMHVPDAHVHVFISYASHDAALADVIVEALEQHGLRCWIAPRDVKAGALYADAIVRAISSAKAFVLVLSESAIASSHVGKEVERASSKKRPIIALRVDAAPLTPALEYFLSESQWVEAQAKNMEAAYSRLIDAIREPERTAPGIIPAASSGTAAVTVSTAHPKSRNNWILIAAGTAVVVVALAVLLAERFWLSKRPTMEHANVPVAAVASGAAPAVPAAPSFNPPAHSIAVLPFVNMSGDKEQEYFSDGLTEELLNSLARINELQVAGRTSSFYYKGEHADLTSIAHKLNVASVLEGSVRRSGQTVRITAQLINAVTGFHLWSQTYDRDLGDVLKLQTDIANSVASALKVTLLGDLAAKVELGGTHNPAAFDAYLRASKAFNARHDRQDRLTAIAGYSEAILLDPNYALAFAGRSEALTAYAVEFATGPAIREGFDKAQADAHRAIALASDLAEGHLALADFFSRSLDFAQASGEFGRAAVLAPGDARVLSPYGLFVARMGRFDAGIASARRGVSLDPLNHRAHLELGSALEAARRYDEAIAAYGDSLTLDPDNPQALASRGLGYYALGKLQNARGSCEIKSDYWLSQLCLAVTYDKLGRHVDAEPMLAKIRASNGDDAAYQYAEIYAQWGNAPKALEWLEVAMRLRDPGLVALKTDSLLDPLRKELRLQAIERALKFPT
jgi:TolB-like protein/Flp pilus assembly protein TadD